MRSNIARTCPSSRVPLRALGPATLAAARLLRIALGLTRELAEERDQVGLLLRVEVGVRRHRRRRVLERALDRRLRQDAADLGQLRTGAVVAVLADLVARQAA